MPKKKKNVITGFILDIWLLTYTSEYYTIAFESFSRIKNKFL